MTSEIWQIVLQAFLRIDNNQKFMKAGRPWPIYGRGRDPGRFLLSSHSAKYGRFSGESRRTGWNILKHLLTSSTLYICKGLEN